jgi:hypothetical protein
MSRYSPAFFRTIRARAGGQALTEFIVMALVLVPLFLLIPMVAKYQEMAHATQMASRYVAFEAATRNSSTPGGFKPETQLKDEVARRFFSNADAAIKTNDVAGDFAANRKPFWVDQKGDPLLKSFGSDIAVSFGESNGSHHTDAYIGADDGKPFEKSLINVRKELGLDAPGLYRGNVSITVANLPYDSDSYARTYETFKSIGLTMTRSTTILVDAWPAKNADQVDQRISKPTLTPGSVFVDNSTGMPVIKKALDVAVGAVELPASGNFPLPCLEHCGPRLGELELWHDIVPSDRLK